MRTSSTFLALSSFFLISLLNFTSAAPSNLDLTPRFNPEANVVNTTNTAFEALDLEKRTGCKCNGDKGEGSHHLGGSGSAGVTIGGSFDSSFTGILKAGNCHDKHGFASAFGEVLVRAHAELSASLSFLASEEVKTCSSAKLEAKLNHVKKVCGHLQASIDWLNSEHISFQSSAIFAIEEEVRSSLSVLLSQFHSALFSLESSVSAHVLGEIKGSILAVDNVMGNIFIGLSGCLKGCVSGSLKGKFEALATVMARLHAKLKGSAGVSGGAGAGISGGICSAINGMLGGSFGVEAGIGGGVGFGVEADANVAGGVGGGLDL